MFGDDLTPQQREAVEHFEGPLLVIAGPGSGKTRVITRRIARLIEQGVYPRNILAITFTNKAANEMDRRVQELIPGEKVWISTFHRMCARLLRRLAPAVGLEQNFTILDTSDQRQLIRQVLSDKDIDATHYSPAKVASRISQAKNRLITPEDMLAGLHDFPGLYFDKIVAQIYTGYQKLLLQSNAVDFDDLLFYIARLLQENEEIRAELDDRFRFVLVDEYQDTNLAQYQIVKALSQDYPNLCATGDPDQSIYGWRGAEIANILRFERDFPQTKVVRLEHNFRSTQAILRAADALIGHNIHRKEKVLLTDNEEGVPVDLLSFMSEQDEADGIARLVSRWARQENRPWSDFAILYRVNALSRRLENAFLRQGIPYQIAAGLEFYERAEIKDLVAYLRLIYNPADVTAFLRAVNTPARGIGKTTQEKVLQWADQQGQTPLDIARRAHEFPGLTKRLVKPLQEFARLIDALSDLSRQNSVEKLVAAIVENTGYVRALLGGSSEQDLQRIANIEELQTAAQQFDQEFQGDNALESFLETTSLIADIDSLAEGTGAGKVTLLTLHAAKGLEFPVVMIVAVEDRILPHERALKDDTTNGHSLEEERRLLFVGATRAKERLCLTHTQFRTFQNQNTVTSPSQFLREMDIVYSHPEDINLPGLRFSPGSSQARAPRNIENIPCEEHELAGEDDSQSPDDLDFPFHDIHADIHAEGEVPKDPPANTVPSPRSRPQTDDASNIDPRASYESNATGADAADDVDTSDATETRRSRRRDQDDAGPVSVHDKHSQLLARLTTGAHLLHGKSAAEIPPPFTVGMTVRHPQLGLGQVIEAQGLGKWGTVTVAFPNGEQHTFVIHKAPLQPVGVR